MSEGISIPLPADLKAARVLCEDLGLKSGRTLAQCHDALRYLAASMKAVANPPKPDWKDPFAPARGGNRRMFCTHCGERFPEDKIQYRYKIGVTGQPLWWCPTPRCDGAGVGFDIHPETDATENASP
jgi:hypothetical protein